MNYSYVTLLTNDSYFFGVALLQRSLQLVNSKYPLLVLVTEDVSKATLNLLRQLNIEYKIVDTISIPDNLHQRNMKIYPGTAAVWYNCWTKFHAFNQTQFDKIVFLDADLLILKNIDNLFECKHMTAALDGEYFNLWPTWPHFNAGCMVIEPSEELFNNIQDFGKALNIEELDNDPNLNHYVVADQELLNLYYKDWPNQNELHLNKYYNVFAPYTQDEQIENLETNCYFIHYVGRKPWAFWVYNPQEHYSEFYYTKGREIVEEACRDLDLDSARKELTLTVYGICKNEKPNVEKFLKSFGEADYVCLLDTGSTDGTWELLKKKQKTMKNLIIKQQTITPWRFDTARNESMKLIPRETTIYFMADLDEVIKEKGWSKKVKNSWHPSFSRGAYNYNRDVDKNDKVIRSIQEYRIHSKEWDHWQNIVHESLINRAGIKQFYIETTTPIDITVWHYSLRTKTEEYIKLCEQDLEEYPNDYVMRLQLAIEYEIGEKWIEAFNHYHWLITNPNTLQSYERARCYSGAAKACLHFNKKEQAFQYFSEGRLLYPYFTDNYLDAALIYFNEKQYNKAAYLCEEALTNCKETHWCSVYDINSFYVYWLAGLSYFSNNQIEKSIPFLITASIMNPIDEYKSILNTAVSQWKVNKRKGD